MTRTKQIVLSLATALSLGAAALAADLPCPVGGPAGGPWAQSPADHLERMMRRATHRLNLTEAQQTALKEIFAQHASELSPLIERARAERREMHAIASAETLDEAALERQAAKIGETTRALTLARAHLRADLRSVLSPEQIDTVMQARRNMGARGGRGRAGFGA